jgi:acyl-CoA thioesterase I
MTEPSRLGDQDESKLNNTLQVKFGDRSWKAITGLTAGLFVLGGCASGPGKQVGRQIGESLVFIGNEPAALAYLPVREHPVSVRSSYLPCCSEPDQPGQKTVSVEYLEGRDFVVDYTQGTLRRAPNSRLPDFHRNMLFGQDNFDHTKFPGFGNTGYFAFADYSFVPSVPWPVQPSQTQFLRKSRAKLHEGRLLKIIAYGDSITAGGDATAPELIFWRRWADELQRNYPRATVTAINGATGGDSTVQGLQRLKQKVLDQKPDLVLIGFGMNDHNNVGNVPIPAFGRNLSEMINRIRNETEAEIVLFSAFPPNPKWRFGSHRMAEYAAATEKIAGETSCAYADIFNNWRALAARKKPEDLLGNNINHPNDFGHWIYFRVFGQLGL